MAATTDPLNPTLAAWRHWDVTPPLARPPTLGPVWAEGSGHRLYALEDHPTLCIRLRHRPTSTVTGGFARELAAWTTAAHRGLAPHLAYVARAEEIVVCERIYPGNTSLCGKALGTLARAIHQLPGTPYALCLHQVLNDYLTQLPAERRQQWQTVVGSPRVAHALRLLEQDTPRLCHNDLTAGNLLYRQEQLIAIDWEYAAMGSRYFDIAIAMAPLPCDAQAALLETAFDGKPDSELLAAGTLIAEICTQLWQACFAATTPLETVLWSHEDKVI